MYVNRLIIALIVGFLVIPTIGFSKEVVNSVVSEDDARKAEYIYLESLKYKSSGELDSFYELLKKAHKLDPTNSIINYYLGYCKLMINPRDKDKADEAMDLMKIHVDKYPNAYDENFIYADITEKLGRNQEAVEVWKRWATNFPDKPDLRYKLADSYASTSDFAKAIETYNKIEKNEGITFPVSVRKINFYLSSNDTINAINEAMNLLGSAPKNARYNVLMADLFLQLNIPDSALVYYNYAQEFEPDNGMVHLSKSSYYNYLNDSLNYDKQLYLALTNENLDV